MSEPKAAGKLLQKTAKKTHLSVCRRAQSRSKLGKGSDTKLFLHVFSPTLYNMYCKYYPHVIIIIHPVGMMVKKEQVDLVDLAGV